MKRRSKTLDELHQIRERMHRETKGMSFEEKIRYWDKRLERLLNEDGYKLEDKRGFKVLKKTSCG